MERYIKPIFEQYYNGDKNAFTPKVYGYDVIKMKDKWICIEKSRNDECTLYGVSTLLYTVSTGKAQRIDLSKPFDTSKEARKYIGQIRKNIDKTIEDALIYGEEKEIII